METGQSHNAYIYTCVQVKKHHFMLTFYVPISCPPEEGHDDRDAQSKLPYALRSFCHSLRISRYMPNCDR